MLLLVAGARLALLAGRALSLAPALLLLLLLALLADRSPRRDLWLAAALLGSLLLLRVLLLDVSERVARRETLRTRAELATRVVDKALALRPQAVKEDADVLQMATTDARNVADATEAVHQVWTASVQIVLAAGMIGYLLGPVPAVTAMAAVALLAIPIASFISARAMDITSKAKDFANIRADMERELLQSIRLVKLCAWENPLLTRIEQVRAQELHSMRQSIVWAVLARVLGAAPTVSTVAALLSFTAFAFTQDASLTPDRAFPVIAVLLIIQEPMRALPGNVNILTRAKISRAKIEAFLELPELISKMESRPLPSPLPSSPLIPHPDDPPFELRSAVFRWVAQNDSKPASFTRLSVVVPRGKLTVVLGPPKSGKSTLVSALIGELCPESGFVNLPQPGTVSFAPETPFLMTTESIQDNILFGAHHDQARLDAVLEACELKPSVTGRLLTQVSKLGDERKILDRALSQRVAFARAVYATSRKELFAMDDSLSELDPGSASRVYNRCLVDSDAILAGTTRVLALSAEPHDYVLELAQRADWIVVMDRQKVVQMGSFNDLVTLQPNGKLAHLVSLLSDKCTLDQISEAVESGCDSRAAVARSAVSGDMSQFPAPNPHIQDRMAHEGTASWSGSALYLSFCGWLMISSAIVLLVFSQLSKVSMDLWLVHWTDESASSQPAAPLQELDLYIYIYLGMSTFVLTGIGDGIIQYGGLRASKAIHSRLLNTVAKASTRFFASQPLEGVARCFSSEMSSIDYELVGSATKTTTNILALASMLMVELFFGPQLLVPLLIPVFAAYVPLRWRYTPRRNILDCYDSKMLYSVNSRLNETISGAATVRAFGMASSISQRFSDCFSEYTYSATQKATLESWLNLRLRLLDATSLLIITFAVVLQPTEDISQAVFALQLLYALSIGVVLNDLATNPGDASRAFSSVQYVSCLWDAETEPISLAVASTEAGRLRSAVLGLRPQWPEQGQINLINVSVNSEHLQSPKSSLGPRPAILGVSLAINAGECVGVCSTGASVDAQRSLLAALFRLTPCSGGVIEIDGVPITQLDLLDLRSRIAVIPSEPLVFVNESLRFNLDPSARSSDDQLWEAMRAAGLDPTPLTLDSHVGSAVATNFGSRLWLARVLVGRPPRVIVVDASGSDGDAMVSAVRSCEPLQTSTVLILAHDAATIADCDRILLLGIDGRVVELGAPAQLLASPSSAFSALLDAADDWAPEV